MTELPDGAIVETPYRTYKYVLTRTDKVVESCSVCGEESPHPCRQIQYHKSKESGHWIMDFAAFGHRQCLKESRRE